jgi:hypothetical protein
MATDAMMVPVASPTSTQAPARVAVAAIPDRSCIHEVAAAITNIDRVTHVDIATVGAIQNIRAITAANADVVSTAANIRTVADNGRVVITSARARGRINVAKPWTVREAISVARTIGEAISTARTIRKQIPSARSIGQFGSISPTRSIRELRSIATSWAIW